MRTTEGFEDWEATSGQHSSNGSPDALIITISGKPGSGKSTVAKAVATRLGLDHFSSGDFMRQMAAERGMSVLELSRDAEDDPEVDFEIDRRTTKLGEERRGFVMDSRLAWNFIPHSLKVFLDVDIDEAVRRIFGAGRSSETENIDLAATRAGTVERQASEAKRYEAYYGIDYLEPSHYDVVVDTTGMTVEEVADEIVHFVRAKKQEGPT